MKVDRLYHFDERKLRDFDLELPIVAGMLARIAAGFPQCRVAAIPNGSKRTRFQRQTAKAEGMATGFPDLLVMAPNVALRSSSTGLTCGFLPPLTAVIEVKGMKAVSDDQHKWLTWLHLAGYPCGVFRSQDTLAAKLKEWGFPHRERG